jgi:hypothetical protein
VQDLTPGWGDPDAGEAEPRWAALADLEVRGSSEGAGGARRPQSA